MILNICSKFLFFVILLIYLHTIVCFNSTETFIDDNDELRSLLEQVKGIVPANYSSSTIQASLSNAVFAIMVNHGFVNQARNLDCYMKRLNFKYLIVALDKAAYDEMKAGMDVTVYLSRIHSSFATASTNYGSSEYRSIVKYKTKMVQTILHMGYDVVFSDTDIAIVRDPFPYMVWNDVDYVHAPNCVCDGNGYNYTRHFRSEKVNRFEGNKGFYFVRSNQHTLEFYHHVTNHWYWLNSTKNEQQSFWFGVMSIWRNLAHFERCEQVHAPSTGWNRTQSPVVACMLDRCLFNQRGMQSQATYDKYANALKHMHETPVTMHANWILGDQEKIEAMKHYGIWLVRMNSDNLTHTCMKPRVLHFEDIE